MDKEDVVYIINIYTVEYYWAIKKNEILPFAETWMGLEAILLNEISQRKANTYDIAFYAKSKNTAN